MLCLNGLPTVSKIKHLLQYRDFTKKKIKKQANIEVDETQNTIKKQTQINIPK